MVPGSVALLSLLLALSAPKPATADDLAWLSGHWVQESPGVWVEEFWTPPRGGTLFAIGRTGDGESLSGFEYLRIAPGPDGRLVLFASPGAGPAVAFNLVEADGSGLRFENPNHDFPQRIVYRRDGDRLEAVISDLSGGREVRFAYQRRP